MGVRGARPRKSREICENLLLKGGSGPLWPSHCVRPWPVCGTHIPSIYSVQFRNRRWSRGELQDMLWDAITTPVVLLICWIISSGLSYPSAGVVFIQNCKPAIVAMPQNLFITSHQTNTRTLTNIRSYLSYATQILTCTVFPSNSMPMEPSA